VRPGPRRSGSSPFVGKAGKILWDRIYVCDCGNIIDRDLNASINLEKYGLIKLNDTELQDAFGQEAVSVKQEENIKC